MNAVTTTNASTAVAVQNDFFDGFQSYGDAAAGTRIIGTMLKFNKGDYLVGANGDIMQEGTELAANIGEMITGWIKWVDKKPAEQIMGRLVDTFARPGQEPKFKIPTRKELGDLDEDLWENDKDGNKQDPWQLTNYLILKVPGLDDMDGLYTMPINSKSAHSAIGKLCQNFAKLGRMRPPGEMPIIKLGVDRYKHKEHGFIKVPLFTIVGWVKAGEFDAALAQEAEQAKADEENRKQDAGEDIPF